MGYRVQADIKAKCPLYEQIVRSGKGKSGIVGVQCSYLHENFGFSASAIIRFRSYGEMMDAKELFCDDLYEACPYYQAYVRAHNEPPK